MVAELTPLQSLIRVNFAPESRFTARRMQPSLHFDLHNVCQGVLYVTLSHNERWRKRVEHLPQLKELNTLEDVIKKNGN